MGVVRLIVDIILPTSSANSQVYTDDKNSNNVLQKE